MPAVASDSPSAPTAAVETAKTDAAKSDSAFKISFADGSCAEGCRRQCRCEWRILFFFRRPRFQPAARFKPANPPKPALRGVRYETPRQKVAWIGLSVLGHGTAAFDAYSTRKAISGGYGTEANPLMRPFAHSNAITPRRRSAPLSWIFSATK